MLKNHDKKEDYAEQMLISILEINFVVTNFEPDVKCQQIFSALSFIYEVLTNGLKLLENYSIVKRPFEPMCH